MKLKKSNKKNSVHENQKSFYFEDFMETNDNFRKLEKVNLIEDRIYILFFIFFSLILIFAISIFSTSVENPRSKFFKNESKSYFTLRKDIVDRNGELLARNIISYHAAVKPDLINNKDSFVVKVKLNFPEIDIDTLKKNLKTKKYFYLKKRLTEKEKDIFWSFGEKGIIIEPFQSRVYPHGKLFSHVLGQVDDDNIGISGIENYFDRELRKTSNIDNNNSLALSLDANLQYLIKEELIKGMQDFRAKAAGALLMDVVSGEVLSLVSLPDYNVNIRDNISDLRFINHITKGVYELGSVFKTFTIAAALENKIVKPETIISNIPNKIQCSKYTIGDIHKFPEQLSVEDILIRSSNIGALMIAQKVGEDKIKSFFNSLGLLQSINFELTEIGQPLSFNWEKCRLETISYGHGITTTPLQAAKAYATIVNGGFLVNPTLIKINKNLESQKPIISQETSKQMNKILRRVVTDKEGTASLADIYGYEIAGKTGTSKYYLNENKNLNTFISVFPSSEPKYVFLVLLDDPKGAPHILYNYRGQKISTSRNEAGWNSVYVAGKIIEKIGPILAINNYQVPQTHVAKKNN